MNRNEMKQPVLKANMCSMIALMSLSYCRISCQYVAFESHNAYHIGVVQGEPFTEIFRVNTNAQEVSEPRKQS
jgi:hypothetical protein